MTYPIVRLVDAPDPSATVRYDFNDADAIAPRSVNADSFTLGAPSLDTPLDAVSPLYGPRSLAFVHGIEGAKTDALTALAVISRELLRPSNWLLVQIDAFTRPTWWRLYATGPQALSFDSVYVETSSGDPGSLPDRWQLPISLTAEAFGYGERIELGPYTVTQDLDGDHPMSVELPTIKGDAPAALRVTVTPSETGNVIGRRSVWMVGCVSGSDLPDLNYDIGLSDGFTAETGTSAGVSDANYSGGSYRTVTVSATDPNLVQRIHGSGGEVSCGRYRAFLRCEADGAAGDGTTYLFAIGQVTGAGDFYAPTKTFLVGGDFAPDITFRGWVDLGEISLPYGAALPPDLTDDANLNLTLMVGTAGGVSGEVRLDALKLIPVESPTVTSATFLNLTSSGIAAQFKGTIDGDSEAYWIKFGDLFWPSKTQMAGGFPTADPASPQNRLLVMAMDQGLSTVDDVITSLGAEAELTVGYHPRLLHLDGRP